MGEQPFVLAGVAAAFLIIYFSILVAPVAAFPTTIIAPQNATSSGPWQLFQKLTGCHRGDNLTGIANLKHYLHTFGYIPPSYANFTDSFDDAIESAIRTYQRNFNLNVTGELDGTTVNQLMLPRCGVADLVNGSNTMQKTTAPSPGQVLHYTYFPGSPRWEKTQLTFAFDTERQMSEPEKTVFKKAFARWGDVTTLVFNETESYINADIKIGFFGGDHGDGQAFDGKLGTLAHAFSPPSGSLHLDQDEDWVVEEGGGGGGSSLTTVDMESVAVHEIGHILGLGHSSVEGSIMYPTITSREKKVDLHEDDVQGIQALYGANPNSRGSPATAASADDEREASSGGGGGGSAPGREGSWWWFRLVGVMVSWHLYLAV